MNEYYNFDTPAETDTLVDANAYDIQMQAITAAFDELPSASQLSAGTLNYGIDIGIVNAYRVSIPQLEQVIGTNVVCKIANTSTGPSTFQLNGHTIANIMMAGEPVAAGDLKAGGVYTFVHDGGNWQCLEMSTRYFGNAQTDAQTAAAYEAAALASKNTAAGSATAAAGSATTAASRVAPAQASATAAAGSASTAANAVTAANGSASAAADRATQATQGATNAAGSATVAATQATAATQAATAAAGSASTAATKATAATQDATDAQNSATAAAQIITNPNFTQRCRDVMRDMEYPVGGVEFFANSANPATLFPGTTWTKLPPHITIRLANATGTDVMEQGGSDNITLDTSNIPVHSHDLVIGAVSSVDLGNIDVPDFDYGTKTTSGTSRSGTSSAFDYGTKTLSSYDFSPVSTNNTGAHNHTFVGTAASNLGYTNVKSSKDNSPTKGVTQMSTVGNHNHTFNLGAHSHSVAMGSHNHTFTMAAHNHTVAIGAHNHTVAIGAHNHTASMAVGNAGGTSSISVLNSCLMLNAWYRSA